MSFECSLESYGNNQQDATV